MVFMVLAIETSSRKVRGGASKRPSTAHPKRIKGDKSKKQVRILDMACSSKSLYVHALDASL
jgi:hypothetical protein